MSTDRPKKIKYLAIIETIPQAKHFLSLPKYRNHSAILAWTPSASQYFKKSGVSYHSISEFIGYQEINEIGLQVIDQVNAICKRVDSISAQHFTNEECRKFPFGSAAWYGIKLLVAPYMTSTVILKKVLSVIKTDKVIIYNGKPLKDISVFEVDLYDQSILHEILSNERVVFKNLKLGEGNRRSEFADRIKSIIKRSMKKLWKKDFPIDPQSEKIILFFQKSYNLPFLYSHFEKDGTLKPVWFDDIEEKRRIAVDQGITELIYKITSDAHIKEHLHCYGVDYTNYFKKYINTGLKQELTEALDYYAWFHAYRNRIGAMVHSAVCSVRDKFLLYLGGMYGIKRVIVSHGDYSGCYMQYAFDPLFCYYNELLWCDKIFVPGSGEKEYIDASFSSQDKTVSTGSIVLERLQNGKLKKEKQKKTVIYPITSLSYLNYNTPVRDRTLFEQSEIIQAVIMCFKDLPDYRLIIKPPPKYLKMFNKYLAIDEFIKENGLSNVSIDDTSLKDLIPEADMFVFDYVSTMLPEMLTTDKPAVFLDVYQPRMNNKEKWDIHKLGFWTKRITILDSIQEIESGLSQIVEKNIGKKYNDIEFLERYGIHKKDGKCLNRMVDFINKEVGSASRKYAESSYA